jgi:hypothetical protein
MKKVLLGMVIGAFAFHAYQRIHEPEPAPAAAPVVLSNPQLVERPAAQPVASAAFRCDGRVHCSEMTSCEEATYFVQNCTGVKMDGDGDGKPCEERCGH